MERDEEIQRNLLAMDASGVRRLPTPNTTTEAGDSPGTSSNAGWPEVVLKFSKGGEGRPALKGRLVAMGATEFVLLDKRTGACWGVSRAKWESIQAAQGESRGYRLYRSLGGEVDPATRIFMREKAKAKASKKQQPRQKRKKSRAPKRSFAPLR